MPYDWSRLVADVTDESFGIPFDVGFQIVENGQMYEIEAHIMILGIVSSTFKTMFYSTDVGDKTAKSIREISMEISSRSFWRRESGRKIPDAGAHESCQERTR